MGSFKLIISILAVSMTIGLVGYIVLSTLIEDIKEKQVINVIKNIIGSDLKREYKGVKLKDIKLKLGALEIYICIEDKDKVIGLKEKMTNEIGNKAKYYFQSCQKHVFSVKVIFEDTWIVKTD
jgi:hypothetical protein